MIISGIPIHRHGSLHHKTNSLACRFQSGNRSKVYRQIGIDLTGQVGTLMEETYTKTFVSGSDDGPP